MHQLEQLDFKINVIPNPTEICMSFSINNNSIFIEGFQFLISSLDSLVENLGKDDFKLLTQEFD